MSNLPNPYSPPSDASTAESSKRFELEMIPLKGNVGLADLENLCPQPWVVSFARLLGLIVLVPVTILTISLLVFSQIPSLPGIASVLVLIAMTFALVFLNRWIGPTVRAKRMVKRNPGVIGPLEGKLDSFGLTYQSDETGQWMQFSWASFSVVRVSRHGIRCFWKSSKEDSIVIPADCIEGFAQDWVKAAIKQFRSKASMPALFRVLPDWTRMPDNAIGFSNIVETNPSVRRGWKVVTSWAFVILFYSLIAIWIYAMLSGLNSGLKIGLSFFGALLIYFLSRLFVDGHLFDFGQWGWIEKERVQIFFPGRSGSYAWTDAQSIRIEGEYLIVTFEEDFNFWVKADDLFRKSDSSQTERDIEQHWNQVVAWSNG